MDKRIECVCTLALKGTWNLQQLNGERKWHALCSAQIDPISAQIDSIETILSLLLVLMYWKSCKSGLPGGDVG